MNNFLGYIALFCFSVASLQLSAQSLNDECEFADFLGTITEFCSGETEFTTEGASLSPQENGCFAGNPNNDVWFSFVPTAPGAFVQLFGQGFGGASLDNPSLAFYQGPCNNLTELACQSIADDNQGTPNLIEQIVLDLTIGQIYYIRVDSRNNEEGSFQLCIESFIPPPSPESDCPDAVILCDKEPFFVQNLNSVGNLPFEMTGDCVDLAFGQDAEEASVWYAWTCDMSGTLTFDLIPNNPNNGQEDLDFILYELPSGLMECNDRFSVRCMLSGETQGNSAAQNAPCFGATGLRPGETDFSEFAGCQNGSNNYLAPLDMVSGVSYALIVNNFSQSGFGFAIEFGGTGTFLGPDVTFDVIPEDNFECDKTINFVNMSSSETDVISDYFWSFGVGANPAVAFDEGPHEVIYESFGEKVAALTVTTSRGCTKTEIIPLEIDPCCADTSTLMVSGLAQSVACFGEENGTILADGTNGAMPYLFSVDGMELQPSPLFSGLASGPHDLLIQDIKGCEDETTLLIDEPEEILVFASPDTTIILGDSVQINAFYTPASANLGISWSPETGLSCTDCLDPWATAPGTTTYTITVTDLGGCTATADVTIRASIERPYYPPTVFGPEQDFNNYFTIFFKETAVEAFESLHIYDRWGNLIFLGENLIVNDATAGWDGTFNGQPVQPAVFTWIASVKYIDEVVEKYTGSITVIR